MKKYIISSGIATFMPLFVFAAGDTSKGLGKIISIVDNLIGLAVPVVISAAVLFFLYGLAMYIWSAGSEKEKGASMMMWGVIGLFVMVSVWGLVRLVADTFDVSNSGVNVENPLNKINF